MTGGNKYVSVKTNSRFLKLVCVYSNFLKTANKQVNFNGVESLENNVA